MACPRCGSVTVTGAAFCSTCGTNLAAPMTGPSHVPPPIFMSPGPHRTSSLAIAGFASAFFCGVLGLIFSVLGYNECKRSKGMVGGEALAIAGIVISCVLGVVQLVYAMSAFALLATAHHPY